MAIGAGPVLSACAPTEASRRGTEWLVGGPAPFSRHAHSAASTGGRLLVMGDRRSWGSAVQQSTSDGEPATTITVIAGKPSELKFDVEEIDVPMDEPVRIVFRNEGAATHDFSVISANVYLLAEPGEEVETIATFRTPDTFFCSVDGHASAGMLGDLLVDGQRAAERVVDDGTAGTTEMWWYDPAADGWEQTVSMPAALNHVSMAAAGGRVYAIGGFPDNIGVEASTQVWAFDPAASTWSREPDLPITNGRGAMATATDGERIYVAGGRSEPEGTPSSREIYAFDPGRGEWERLAALLPTGRDHVDAAVLNGTLWVMGGRGNGRRVDSTPVTEGLDLSTGEWTIGRRVPVPESAGGVAAVGGRVVVFGGEAPAPTPAGAAGRSFTVFNDVYAYDPERDAWERWEPMPTGVHHPAFDTVDGVLVSVGGGVISGVSESNHVQLLAPPG